MGGGNTRTPKGWVRVPDLVREAVLEAVRSLGPNLNLNNFDSWGAGVSPRVARMVRTLGTPDAHVGASTLTGLRSMLVDGNDETFKLLGGETTWSWAFAPAEFDAMSEIFFRLKVDLTEEQLSKDPEWVAALSKLDAAVEASAHEWTEAHPSGADEHDK